MPYVGPAPTPNAPKDLQGGELILDADNDTTITADTDDQIDIKIAGSDEIKITAAMIAPASADGSALGGTSNEWSDLYLADGAVIGLGADQDVTLTHVADTGILLNSTMAIQFNDASQYINAPSNAILDINATDEIELNATLADVNANLDVSGTYTGGGLMTTGGNIVIPDAGNIGSASDTDAVAISSAGVVALSATTEASATGTAALTVAGGLGIAKDVWIGDDVVLDSDSAVLKFGADQDVTITHAADASLTLAGSTAAQLIMSTGSILPKTDTDTSNTGSVTLDFKTNQNFVLTFTGNVTLANPTTETAGQSGVIVCIQDGTGSRTLSLGTDYETAGGSGITLSTGANDVDVIPYFVKAAGSIQLGAVQKDFS